VASHHGRPVFVLTVDVEPDGRDEHPAGTWHGFVACAQMLERARPRLRELTGAAVAFNWFLRMDPQVEALCGPNVRQAGRVTPSAI